MRAHEAGALHAPGYGAPYWLVTPNDPNALVTQLWPQGVERHDNGQLHIRGRSVVELAAEYGTPTYFLDAEDMRTRMASFEQAFAKAFAPHNGAQVFYAGKAFLCRRVARWAADAGLGVDTSSYLEMETALAAGVPAKLVTLHGNNKSDTELRRAVEAGLGKIVVDHLSEIHRVNDIAAALGTTAPVMVRVTVGVEAHTHSYIATAHEDQKFGISLATGEALTAVTAAVNAPNVELIGLHSHIGSQIFDLSGFEVAAKRLVGLHAQVATQLGVVMPWLNLGGGYGMSYTTEHTPLTPQQIAEQLAHTVATECDRAGVEVPTVCVEPGRAIAGPSTFTLYEVGTVKDVRLENGQTRKYVSVDGGMSDNIRTALYAADYSATVASRASSAPPALGRVVGKHCESGDIVVMDEFVPEDVGRGDLLAVPGTGAYCRSLANNYNLALRPPVVAVEAGGECSVLVRRELPADLLGLDVS